MKKAGVCYRNPYQTRHTYASMMLSGGENIMWLPSQMGHVDTEMVMRTYGKWISNEASKKDIDLSMIGVSIFSPDIS